MFGSKIGKAETRAANSSTRGLLVRQHSPAAARSFGTSVKAADGDHEQDAKVALDPERADLRGLNWSLSRISILPPEVPPPAPALSKPPAVILQRKLAIGSVDDPLEHEADRVAEQVVQMPDPRHAAASAPQQISRNWVAREKDGKLQEKEAEPHEAEAPASVHEALRSPGQPLDAATRAYFEPRFGHDFSNVRVHTDDRAAESARDVSAVAYTVGRHVVFGRGLYPPSSLYGRRLLAHELAHVAQQGSAAVIVARQVAEESSQTYSLQPAYNFAEAEKEIELSETPSTGAFLTAYIYWLDCAAKPFSNAGRTRASELLTRRTRRMAAPFLMACTSSARKTGPIRRLRNTRRAASWGQEESKKASRRSRRAERCRIRGAAPELGSKAHICNVPEASTFTAEIPTDHQPMGVSKWLMNRRLRYWETSSVHAYRWS